MTAVTSVAAVVLVVLVAWAPGLLVLRAARVRGLLAVAAAPAVTTGVAAAAAVPADLAGIRWGLGTAAVATAVTALGVAGAARLGGPAPERVTGAAEDAAPPVLLPPVTGRRRLALALAAGTLLQLVPLAVAARSLDRIPVAHDAVTHFAALGALRDAGTASSLAFWPVVSPLDPPAGPYAAGWHAIGTLLPAWPDATVMTNLLTFVPSALAWTTGVAALTAVSLPRRPRVAAWAGLLSAGGGAVPLVLVLRPEGMIPNAFALSLLPGVLALGLALVRAGRASGAGAWAAGVVAAGGLAAAHPTTVLTAAVLVLPAGTVWLVRRLREGRWPARVAAAAGGAVAVAAALVAVASPAGARVVEFPPERPEPVGWAFVWLASGDLTKLGPGAGFVLVVAAVVGALLARRLPSASWLVGAGAAITLLYLTSTSALPVITDVDRAWYGEPRRFGPALMVAVVPLAALAVDTVPRWVVVTRRLPAVLARRVGVATLSALVVLPGVLVGAVRLAMDARETLAPEAVGLPGVAGPAELAMMRRLEDELDPGRAVLGSPFSGAAHVAALADRPVVLPSTVDVDDDTLSYVRDHLDDLGRDPELCRALDELDVGYLYVDPAPWNVRHEQLDIASVPPGTRIVDRGGSAVVVEVTAC